MPAAMVLLFKLVNIVNLKTVFLKTFMVFRELCVYTQSTAKNGKAYGKALYDQQGS